jgi:hypothetical protein
MDTRDGARKDARSSQPGGAGEAESGWQWPTATRPRPIFKSQPPIEEDDLFDPLSFPRAEPVPSPPPSGRREARVLDEAARIVMVTDLSPDLRVTTTDVFLASQIDGLTVAEAIELSDRDPAEALEQICRLEALGLLHITA